MTASEDHHLFGFGVPVAWLVELDNCPSPYGLADAFGDCYLCKHNPIFANIRHAAVRFGYRFSAEATQMWRDYHSFGLATLHKILTGRIIPYHDTGSTFRRLLEDKPKAALPPGFIINNVKRNHAFHESAHCVAHSLLQRMESGLRAVAPTEKDRFVLEAILAESFANTVERLGTMNRRMPLSDTLFYAMNSYMAPREKIITALERAGSEMSENQRFALLFLAAFEANVATNPPGDGAFERVATAAGCGSDLAEIAREIIQIGLNLAAGFRENTTPMYFELVGHLKEYTALSKSCWLSRAENLTFIRDLTQVLFETATTTVPFEV